MLSVVLFASSAGVCLSQEFVKLSPQKAEIMEGGNVLFTCLSELGFSQWTWSSSTGHYFKIETSIKNDCTIVDGLISFYSLYCNKCSTSILLQNIIRSRHGERWDCRQRSYRSNSALVYVTVPVTFVQIEPMESIISTTENSIINMSCQTSFARPAPNVEWYLSEDNISGMESPVTLSAGITEQIHNSTDELFSTKSEISYQVNRSFDGRGTYCSSNNYPAITGTKCSSAKILFNVSYIPHVSSFFVKGFEGKDIIIVRENDTVQFTCLIDMVASNAKLTFNWKTILFEEFDTSNLTYTLNRVSCRDTGDYTCVARNAFDHVETSTRHITLFVSCPPHANPSSPIKGSVLAKPGDTVTFSLDIMAYPEPRLSDYVWMNLYEASSNLTILNNGLHTEISTRGLQTHLTIKSVTSEDYGTYRLTVVNGLGAYSHNFFLGKEDTKELADNNVISIVVCSVVGSAVLIGIICVAIFLTRNVKHNRECPCISNIMKGRGRKETSTIPSTSPSASAESNKNASRSEPQNIYEKLQRNGEVEREYQEIQLGGDDKCVYKNIKKHPPQVTSSLCMPPACFRTKKENTLIIRLYKTITTGQIF